MRSGREYLTWKKKGKRGWLDGWIGKEGKERWEDSAL